MSRLHDLNVLLAGVETPDDLTEQERANHRSDLCEFLQSEIDAESEKADYKLGRLLLAEADVRSSLAREREQRDEDLVLKAEPEGQRFQDASLGGSLLK